MGSQHTPEMSGADPKPVQQSATPQPPSSPTSSPTVNDNDGPTTQDAFQQKVNLITPGAAAEEESIPPPPYGEAYGEIHSDESSGMGTSAEVTDDGRVNIRINHLNRRLSQIFVPALRQPTQDAPEPVEGQDGLIPVTSPYIPSYLQGAKPGSGILPPPMNIVIQVVGSRGDVQPFVALAKVLKDTYGHRIRFATHPNFQDFVLQNGLEFFSIGGDPSRLMSFMVNNPSLLAPGIRSVVNGDIRQRRRDVAEYMQGCWRSCYEAGDGLEDDIGPEAAPRPFVADCIIANPPSFAHIHCAEKLGIPLHIMFTMPYSPTQAFPHPLANIQSTNADPQLTNYISYAMVEMLSWQGLGEVINRFRAKCLSLDPISRIWAPGMLERLKIPHTYCWSPALIPKPKDWGPHISITGFCFLESATSYTPDSDLKAFLDDGPPPVYIGFGSIVLDNPDAMTELIFEAVRKTGQRVILSKGWGGMGTNSLQIPDNIFMLLGNVPHDWLFQYVSCVVHHGGAGTTAAGIAAQRPTVVVPFFGDQPFWGAMVARAGAGPNPIPHKQLTADKLADAINFCLKPESLDRAKELAAKIAAEPPGSETAAQVFHQDLGMDRLRCTLAPSRAAVWRLKRTKVLLSPFAACTLANANLLEFNDLKLFRAQEYETDKGPWDPLSGGFVAFCEAVGSMATGLAEIPTETAKAVQIPFRHSNRNSSESSTLRPPLEQSRSQTNLSVQGNTSEPARRLSSQSTASGLSYAASGRSSKQKSNVMNKNGVDMRKGGGRFAKTIIQSPMDLSMGVSKGLHNLPRLWGDETVRPQEKVTDFKSGAKAAGKEFGLGLYDGVTGLVTQPWKGARKNGVSGFAKGVGKGMGGFFAKSSAGTIGILSYSLKGVHKEAQKLYSGNVQNNIMGSRVTQGYEEWQKGSEEEKQDVIARWKLVQKHLKGKKKYTREEMMQHDLEMQRQMSGNAAQPSTGSARFNGDYAVELA